MGSLTPYYVNTAFMKFDSRMGVGLEGIKMEECRMSPSIICIETIQRNWMMQSQYGFS